MLLDPVPGAMSSMVEMSCKTQWGVWEIRWTEYEAGGGREVYAWSATSLLL